MPDAEAKRAILDLVEAEEVAAPAAPVDALTQQVLHQARDQAAKVHLAPALKDFIVRLVMATRPGGAVADAVEYPVSPRGTLALASAVRARAWLHGRDHGLREDAAELAADALSHRLVPAWAAASEGRTKRMLVAEILQQVRPW